MKELSQFQFISRTMRLLLAFSFLSTFLLSTDGLKILGVMPFGSTSHFAIGHGILKSLLKAGHEVTVISPYPQKKKLENYRDVDVSSMLEGFKKGTPNPLTFKDMSPLVMMAFLSKIGGDLVEIYMQHANVINLMESGEKFDVCIIELFQADAFLGIADHVDCVLVTYATFNAVKFIDNMTGNQSPYSYVPQPFMSFTERMNFKQRLINTVVSHIENIAFEIYHLPKQRKLYKKFFPNAKKSFDEIYKSSAIIFTNNHVSASSARPNLPNVIEIAGIHVEPAKPLPKNIQEFLDSAEDGAILFSMGSIIQAIHWPDEIREAFVKAFGKLKQKVLWKYENATLPNKPDNVMIGSWIPQRDIVAHPNVKLFITHGGLLGTTEALVEGVPVLGIPIFGDQKMNMEKAVSRGYGLQVFYDDITEENISKALNELLSNPKYKQNAEEISKRFVDRPMTPQKSVVYWTEYAFRHKGAPHLKAAGNDLSFIEFHLLDVYLTLAAIGFAILYLDYLLLKFLFAKTFKKKSNDAKLKTK